MKPKDKQDNGSQQLSRKFDFHECRAWITDTAKLLESVSQEKLDPGPRSTWLRLRLAHEELITKILKLQRQAKNLQAAKIELAESLREAQRAKKKFIASGE